MKKQVLFLGISFFTVIFWQWAYYRVNDHYSGLNEASHHIELLEDQLTVADAKLSLAEYKLADFKENVAKTLPDFEAPALNREQVMVRGLASVVRAPNESQWSTATNEEKIKQASRLYEQHKFDEAIALLNEVIASEAVIPSIARAHFILAESYFQTERYPECLSEARFMMSQFPEEEVTGYVLLRMGQILQEQNRMTDAAETFTVVQKSFRDENLQKKAKLLKAQLGPEALEYESMKE